MPRRRAIYALVLLTLCATALLHAQARTTARLLETRRADALRAVALRLAADELTAGVQRQAGAPVRAEATRHGTLTVRADVVTEGAIARLVVSVSDSTGAELERLETAMIAQGGR